MITTAPAPPARPGWWMPSLADILFSAAIIWMFATGEGWKTLLGDGDTGWHIRTGEWIIANGRTLTTDIFSLMKYGEPWFAWEWLAGVLYSWLFGISGLKGVVLLSGVMISATAAILFQHMMWRGSNLFLALALAFLSLGASSVHFLARPHLFTILFWALSLWLIEIDRRRPGRLVWLIVPITALWTNLHGGFVALNVTLGLVAVGEMAEGWLAGGGFSGAWRRGRRYVILTAAAAAATLINPFFYTLHFHIVDHLRAKWILDFVQEFQSPDFRHESMFQLELILATGLGVAGLLVVRRRITDALLMAFWAHAALVSVRHVPLYVIAASPFIAAELTVLWKRWVANRPKRSLARTFEELSNDTGRGRLYMGPWSVVLVIVLATWDMGRWPKDFPQQLFPVAMIDKHPEVFGSDRPFPRIYSNDQWGDYLIFRFYPRARVSFDGRCDFYGEKYIETYVSTMGGAKGWRGRLSQYDYVLAPAGWALSELLRADPDWRLLEEDKLGVLYGRVAVIRRTSQ